MLMLGKKCPEGMEYRSEKLRPPAPPAFLYNMNQNQTFLPSCEIYPHELPTILKNNFQLRPHPQHKHPHNPFCPICLKIVPPDAYVFTYYASIFGKPYLAHEACLLKEDGNCLNTILQEVTHAKLSTINSINQARSFCFGEKEYYIEMAISHPLTSKPFFTLKNKIQTNGSFLVWNFQKFHQQASCFPNVIAFPYPDFEIEISYCKLTQREGRYKQKAFVNLQKMHFQGQKLLKVSTQQFDLILKVVTDEKQKAKIVDQMNFKYQHSLDIPLPLVQIIKLQLKLPNNDSDQENQYICSRQNSSITELLNQNSPQTSTIKSSSYYDQQRKSAYLSEVSQRSFQKQKVDLSRLISSGKLSEYVKNNIQSRNFQAYLTEVTNDQLNDILRTLSPDFCELVTHQYANYMMQKLFTICNTQQRMFILQKLTGSIPMLVKNKQGTHTLQTLVALLTQEEEHCLLVQTAKKDLYELSEHSNATHFIQKIINIIPARYTLPYFHFAAQNFVKFALNKNAMCVLKQMMKRLRDIQDAGFKSLPRSQAEDIVRKFLNATAMNIDRVIQDCYGNYVVQFCYEFFGFQRCVRITEMILDRFPQFSIQRYSSSVVLKCLEIYWGNKETIEKLKYSLNGNSILDMYRNKQGNKILLTIMQRYDNTAIREKIYSQLVMAEPAKFQHDRWGITLGSRSGTVGTNWSSFPQAVKPSPNRKKKHQQYTMNIIQ